MNAAHTTPPAAAAVVATPATGLPLARLLGHTAAAVQAVRAGQSLNTALARCPAVARPGTQAVSFAVLRQLGLAQALRERLASRAPPAAVDALLLSALVLLLPDQGADAPAYAEHTVVDQAVLAVRQQHAASAGFVNAVLRRFLRERSALLAAVQADPVAQHKHPAWWIDRLRSDWPEHWQAVLAANNQHPPMVLRVNARHVEREAYRARLHQAGLATLPLSEALQAAAPQALVLAEACPVQRLPGFDQGDVSVQDSAAQQAAPLLLAGGLPAGARVLDACAAPGGKTAHLLELADLSVLALDSDAQRLRRVHDSLARLGLQAQTVAADAGNPAAWWDGQPFDAILLDAPCSASGIVRRHPDVRWLRRPSDIPALAALQARLLDALWPLLRPGGRLLYATCSVFKAEGQDQIDAFLQRQTNAQVMDGPAAPGHLLPLPDNGQTNGHSLGASPDGFFYALLHKTPTPG